LLFRCKNIGAVSRSHELRTSPGNSNLTLEKHKPVLSLFLLVGDFSPFGEAQSVRLLATSLPRDRFRVTVGVLGQATGPQFDDLRNEGIAVYSLPIRHLFDMAGMRRLQQTVREVDPVVVHTWGPGAAGASRLIISRRGEGANSPRFVVSGASTPGGGIRGWLVARQVRSADRVITKIRVDGERYRQIGVPSERLTLISPAAPTFSSELNREKICKNLDIPPTSIILVGGDRSDRGIGPKDAIVAFDMLRYDFPDLRLIVFGTGTEAKALEQFGRALAFDDFRVHFPECSSSRPDIVQLSRAVLITNARGGVEEALEAMSAGKPVVGWKTPELAEIVDDGVTGFLVKPGDRAALASKTRQLLDEPDLIRRMAEAGHARVAARFGIGRMIEQYARLYEELSGTIR
jgi:glycosyltransferase involved in cell wall biosynthesis